MSSKRLNANVVPAKHLPQRQVMSTSVAPRNVPRSLWQDVEKNFFRSGGLQSIEDVAKFMSQVCRTELLASIVRSMLIRAIEVEAERIKSVLEHLRVRRGFLDDYSNRKSSRRLLTRRSIAPQAMLSQSGMGPTPRTGRGTPSQSYQPQSSAVVSGPNIVLREVPSIGQLLPRTTSVRSAPLSGNRLPSLRLEPLKSEQQASLEPPIVDTLPPGHFGLTLPLNDEGLVESTLALLEPSAASITFDALKNKGLVTVVQIALLVSWMADPQAEDRGRRPSPGRNQAGDECASALEVLKAMNAESATTTFDASDGGMDTSPTRGGNSPRLQFATLQRLLQPFGVDVSAKLSLGQKAHEANDARASSSTATSVMMMSRTVFETLPARQGGVYADGDDVYSAVQELLDATAAAGDAHLHNTDEPVADDDVVARLTPMEARASDIPPILMLSANGGRGGTARPNATPATAHLHQLGEAFLEGSGVVLSGRRAAPLPNFSFRPLGRSIDDGEGSFTATNHGTRHKSTTESLATSAGSPDDLTTPVSGFEPTPELPTTSQAEANASMMVVPAPAPSRTKSCHQLLHPSRDVAVQTDIPSFTQLWLGSRRQCSKGVSTSEAGHVVGRVVSLPAIKAKRHMLLRAEHDVTLLKYADMPLEALERLYNALGDGPHGPRLVTKLKKY